MEIRWHQKNAWQLSRIDFDKKSSLTGSTVGKIVGLTVGSDVGNADERKEDISDATYIQEKINGKSKLY